jgi:hypothetical protein
MNYFVSAENNAYQHWQLELLIESFKLHNLEDSLLIALAHSDEQVYVNYNRNLFSHKRIFTHDNVGRELNCLHFNRTYSLYSALKADLIKPPIFVLHPDMVLIKPYQPQTFDITFQLDIDTTIEKFKGTEVEDFANEICKIQKLEPGFWINLGDSLYLQNFDISLVERVLSFADFFAKKYPGWEYSEKVAWSLALLEFTEYFSYYGTYGIENIMLDMDLKYVINYKRGLPPFFNKKMFKFQPPNVFGMGEPYDILLENNPSKVTNYLQEIIRSYKSKELRKDIGSNSFGSQVPVVNVSTPRSK